MVLECGGFGNALAAAACLGWKRCAEILIEAKLKESGAVESQIYHIALRASQAALPEVHERPFDGRDEDTLRRQKHEVAELLKNYVELSSEEL
jgi:hypothetical protein